MALPKENVLPETISSEKYSDIESPLTETKIAFEEIENEKLEMSLRERERLDTMPADEMAELQKELERMAILKAAKECINPEQKDLGGRQNTNGSGASGSEDNHQGEAAGGTANPSLRDYLSNNMQVWNYIQCFRILYILVWNYD